tara:strand:+ start:368 stop:697 length:330 start_codon:yes stop_codon:yes gene_type:complete
MITWKIVNIEYIILKDGLTSVAKNVHWYASDVGDLDNWGNCWGNQQLDISGMDASSFTSWDSLSESQVLGWVKSAMGEEEVERVEKYIEFTIGMGTMTERQIGLPNWND